jgi:hypothetical protein
MLHASGQRGRDSPRDAAARTEGLSTRGTKRSMRTRPPSRVTDAPFRDENRSFARKRSSRRVFRSLLHWTTSRRRRRDFMRYRDARLAGVSARLGPLSRWVTCGRASGGSLRMRAKAPSLVITVSAPRVPHLSRWSWALSDALVRPRTLRVGPQMPRGASFTSGPTFDTTFSVGVIGLTPNESSCRGRWGSRDAPARRSWHGGWPLGIHRWYSSRGSSGSHLPY